MAGTGPPQRWNHPPPAPVRYSSPSAPVENPSSVMHAGQYPLTGPLTQHPPPGGYYAPWSAAPPPNRYPGQYHPPTVPAEYPPHATLGFYPPSGAPARYPLPSAQYPPPGTYPGASCPYPPSGGCPPPGVPSEYPQPGGYPPPAVGYPLTPSPGYSTGSAGEDIVDLDGVDCVCARHSSHPVHVEFCNRTGMKIVLMEGDEQGKFTKVEKLKNGESVKFDSYETHPFWATAVKDSCKGYPVINGNLCYFLERTHNGPSKVVDITIGPHLNHLRSTATGPSVVVKFSNRTLESVLIKAVDMNGHTHVVKNLSSRMAWVYRSFEGQYFTACKAEREHVRMDMNLGEFYLVRQGNDPMVTKKVIITELPEDSESSSDSSCSGSSCSSDSDY